MCKTLTISHFECFLSNRILTPIDSRVQLSVPLFNPLSNVILSNRPSIWVPKILKKPSICFFLRQYKPNCLVFYSPSDTLQTSTGLRYPLICRYFYLLSYWPSFSSDNLFGNNIASSTIAANQTVWLYQTAWEPSRGSGGSNLAENASRIHEETWVTMRPCLWWYILVYCSLYCPLICQ